MTYNILFYSKAEKALKAMQPEMARRIKDKIRQYAQNPEAYVNNIKPLKGTNAMRLRVGDWRIVMELEGSDLVIIDIGHRGSIYERMGR